MGKKCIQLNLVAFGCIFLPGSKFANTCFKLTFLPGQTRPKRFLPCQSFYRFGPVSFAVVCSRVTKFVSEQSACYVVSDELNVMFAIHVLFLYRLSGLRDCFCNKRFLSCRFHFQVYQTDVLVSYTWKINKNIVTELVYLVHS